MWERAELKSRAKNVLRGNYWTAFLVSLAIISVWLVMNLFFNIVPKVLELNETNTKNYDRNIYFEEQYNDESEDESTNKSRSISQKGQSYNYLENINATKILKLANEEDLDPNKDFENKISSLKPTINSEFMATAMIIIIFLVAFVFYIPFYLLIYALLEGPLVVGGYKYFIQSAQYKYNKKCFRFIFNGEHYFSVVKSMFRAFIQNFLWYLLFIIPGIYKTFSYAMVPYILADNPTIGSKRAIELSEKMMEGNKIKLVILIFSFFGWYLLGFLAFGIGVFFVNPYLNATKAEFYLVLRQNAFYNNICTYEELRQMNPNFMNQGNFGYRPNNI